MNEVGGVREELIVKKKVVEARVHNVPRAIYRTIRSFVESSPKVVYHWNIGVLVEKEVIFEKCGKWRLIVDLKEKSIVLEKQQRAALILRKENGQWRMSIEGVPEVFPVEINVLRANYIVSDVPFARLIAFNEIFSKIEEFVEIV